MTAFATYTYNHYNNYNNAEAAKPPKGMFVLIKLALTIIQLIAGVALVVIIIFQSGKSAGLSGAIAGAADTFLDKNKAKSLDARLAKLTKWLALGFVVLTLLLNILA